MNEIRKGMQVFLDNGQTYGTVDNVTNDGFVVNGRTFPRDLVSRVDGNRVYLSGANTGTATGYQQNANELKVPVVEEQLNVGKRQNQIGEVQVRKTVREEQQNVPVELRREEVNVHQRDIEDRPLQPGEDRMAFQEGTIRVPVRGEEAVVDKQAVVTGEVHIKKDVTSEQQQVADTVRKEEVNVDKNFDRNASRVNTDNYNTTNRDYATTGNNYNTTDRGYNTGNQAYTAGATGAGFNRSQLTEGTDVVGTDNDFIGRVKQVRGDSILVDRTMKRDVYVPMSAVQSMDGGRVVLNVASQDVDDQGWANPPLTGEDNTDTNARSNW
ncbi:MAG TPA: DUF2382 domain-containing protein [Chloroflexia bacterium]|nr:DUF2382 domain-containing protein [Chloroflexia bacterium]